jgi:hypothetical protein
MDSFHWPSSSCLFHIQWMSLWITDTNVSPPAWISCAGIWSLPGDLYFSYIAISVSTSKWLGLGTSSSAVCISICLTSLTLCIFDNWDLYTLQSIIRIIKSERIGWAGHAARMGRRTCIGYWLGTPILFIYASINVFNILVLNGGCKLSFVLQR